MNPLWLFDTCGWIFGPAIMAAGVIAITMCAWVTFGSASKRARRRTVALATLPLLLGICGFLVGLALAWNQDMTSEHWLALGKVCLAGAMVTLVPLPWALWLIRLQEEPTAH